MSKHLHMFLKRDKLTFTLGERERKNDIAFWRYFRKFYGLFTLSCSSDQTNFSLSRFLSLDAPFQLCTYSWKQLYRP